MTSHLMAEPDASARQQPWRRTVARAALPVVAVALLLVGWFVAEPVTIESDSMAPTIVAGQRVLLDKLSYHLGSPDRGDLVAFDAPDTGALTLKRIVGIAGDTVAIKDGVLWVNSRAVREPYVNHDQVDSVYFGPVGVAPETVFVMGDNRAVSIDSRAFGPVPTSDIVGRVLWSGFG